MRPHRLRALFSVLALTTAIGLVAGACGSSTPSTDGPGDSATTAPSAPGDDTPADPVVGCEGGWTDPSDLSPTRAVARCEPGAPAPQPLAEPTTIVVATTTTSAELAAPILWAIEEGEFAKENLQVELQVIPPPEALNLLAQDNVQAWLSSPDAAFHNALDQGYDLRWVAGNFTESPSSRSGLWLRGDDAGEAAVEALEGQPVATVSGIGSVITYPINTVLTDNGLSISDIDFKTFSAPDVISALENGAVSGAWLLTPAWQQVDGQPGFQFVAGQPPGEPLGGIAFGSDLLDDRPEVGEAFLRAYIRTINTYFAGDYKSDPAFVAQISERTSVPVESLDATAELVFDWEIRDGTSARMQEVWHQTGALKYGGVIAEDEVVDRRIYEAVVGHQG
jgi:NitT/TauT family transport system substrate-binding protein